MNRMKSQNNHGRVKPRLYLFIAAAALILGAFPVWHERVFASSPRRVENTAFTADLPNAKGKRLTLVTVSYAPGESSPRHKHAGSVVAYVLSGEIRSQNSATGPARVYKTGECFFEPPGSEHLISENASKSKPASLLAIFVADDNATLTQPAP